MSLKEEKPKDRAKALNLQVVEESLPPKTLPKQGKIVPEQMNTSSSDFAALSQLPSYVDQTLVVAQVQYGHDVTLVTAPKGWGKTTLISTLKYFYEIQVKPNGEKVTNVDFPTNIGKELPEDNTRIKDTPNYRLFEGTRLELEEPLVMEHLGKYPVILLKFKGNVNNIKEALNRCRNAIREACLQHPYLANSTKLAPGQKSRFKQWSCNEKYRNMGWNDVASSIKDLSECLCTHWDRKCVILIDDYDAITMSCLKSESITRDKFNTIQTNLVRMLLYTLKDNSDYMERGFVIGSTYVLSLLSSVNNLDKGRFVAKHDYTEFGCLNGCDEWEDNEIPSNNEKLKHFSVW